MATLDSATDSVDAAMEEIRVLRCDLQRMATAREDADAVIQGKERELQMVTLHLRRVEELLRRSEDCQKKLENKIRQALTILDEANAPPAEDAILVSESCHVKKSGSRAARRMRKPHTPFLLWCKDKRQEVCDAHPAASTADLYAIMLKGWDGASVEDKDRYGRLHRALCEKHALKVAAEAKLSETDPAQETVPSDEEHSIKQKAMSLLGHHLASRKAEAKETGAQEVSSEASTSLTSADSASSALAEEGSSSESALPVHEDAQTCSAQLESLGDYLKAAREDPSAYLLFSMEQRKKLSGLYEPDMTHCKMNATIAKLWRELPPIERRNWHEAAVAAHKIVSADQTIPPLRIPAELKLESPKTSGTDDCKYWMFRKPEDIGGNTGIHVPVSVSKDPIWEQLGNPPVNTLQSLTISNPDSARAAKSLDFITRSDGNLAGSDYITAGF